MAYQKRSLPKPSRQQAAVEKTDCLVEKPAESVWQGFQTGFRNGTLWSLILAVPTVPLWFSELKLPDEITQEYSTTQWGLEKSVRLIRAIGYSLTAITLPWAIAAGFARIMNRRRA